MKEINMQAKSNYRVGYCRPPKDYQFQPGQSGNPSGRPKAVRSFKSELHDELSELISVSYGDKIVEITKQRAILKAIVDAALSGDFKAANTVLTLCSRASAHDPTSPTDEIATDEADQAIAAASAERQRKRADAIAKSESKED